MEKDKKKTLTISSNLKKKIDTSSISTSGKKSFSVEKKKPFRSNKQFNKQSTEINTKVNPDNKRKNFARKFVEQQATKVRIYPQKSKSMNLAFDVTPAKYVKGLITEKGICEASEKGLKGLFK